MNDKQAALLLSVFLICLPGLSLAQGQDDGMFFLQREATTADSPAAQAHLERARQQDEQGRLKRAAHGQASAAARQADQELPEPPAQEQEDGGYDYPSAAPTEQPFSMGAIGFY